MYQGNYTNTQFFKGVLLGLSKVSGIRNLQKKFLHFEPSNPENIAYKHCNSQKKSSINLKQIKKKKDQSRDIISGKMYF